MTTEEIRDNVITLFDSLVRDITKEKYASVCEDLAREFDSRLEAVNAELEKKER